ncbi:MAG: M1 family peptidase [Bacteroidetes bacterium]|nr:MAG: M1 family peptidase [Bacteroidota bacterium]
MNKSHFQFAWKVYIISTAFQFIYGQNFFSNNDILHLSLNKASSSHLSVNNEPHSEYFQQQVNYTISVTLNDQEHSLKGFETIEYINHSPDTLKYIYFHLWPNAYKNHSTCLAQQFLQLEKKDFYFSKPQERGYIDSLKFFVNNIPAKFLINKDTIDLGILYLNKPLPPQQSIIISTPFYVKIPDAKFSRLGHYKNAYYITQWYPKPAVYDRFGWHPMPYLHNGEFYSEFGNYDVSITLPENYVLAATGNRLADEKETNFLFERINLTKKIIEKNKDTIISNQFPESSHEYKTVRFVESNIHDFAWFADKRFLILNDEIEIFESKKRVKTWLYFTPANLNLWKDALEYINEATLFYSYYVGDYPYNNISAVDGATAAGGGMEYPTITLINQSSSPQQLEETIVHEVGHNWFYGILGTNERDYPAMDEGVNSFYEMRYLYKKYPHLKLSEMFGLKTNKKLMGLEKLPQRKYYEWAYLTLATHNADLPILQHSTKYTELNYGGIVYAKTALVMEYLKNYFGEDLFDEAMAFYFKSFRFKHPYPQDLKILLDYFGGGDNIPLIEQLILTNKKIDYQLVRIKKNQNNVYEITLKNKGAITAPVVIQALKNNTIISEIWKNNITDKETFSFPPLNVDYFRIDYNEITPDINRRNNTIRTSGIFKKVEPLQFNLIWKVDDFYRTQFHYSPVVGWNYNDGYLLGAALYNYGVFPKKIEGFIAPLYAFKSNTYAGSGDIYINLFPNKLFKILQLGIAGKTYSYWYSKNHLTQEINSLQYLKIEPYLNAQFKQKHPLKHQRHLLNIRTVWITNRNQLHPLLPSSHQSFNWINEYAYTFHHKNTITPYKTIIQLQHNDAFLKSMLTFSGKIYTTVKKYFEYRIFFGKFLYGNTLQKSPYAFRPSGYSNTQDYMMDDYYLGRFQGDNIYRQQFSETEGNMKTWTALGYSTNWMGAVNLYSPAIKGFRIFADLVVSDQKYLDAKTNTYKKILFDAGICLKLGESGGIYLPLLMSNVLKDNLQLNGFNQWYHIIRYSLNIKRINPRFEITQFIE